MRMKLADSEVNRDVLEAGCGHPGAQRFARFARSAAALGFAVLVCAAPHALAQNAPSAQNVDDGFGTAVAVGDFNGDRILDLAVGVPGENRGNGPRGGVVLLFQGTRQGLRSWSSVDAAPLGRVAGGDRFGVALAVGDFNRDGRADLAVGAPSAQGGTPAAGGAPNSATVRAGAVFVFLGAANGVTPVRRLGEVTGMRGRAAAGDSFGSALVTGDFDRDGVVDLAVGAPNDDPGDGRRAGAVFVFRSMGNGSFRAAQALVSPAEASPADPQDDFGFSLAAGDFNADGAMDLAVGAPGKASRGGPRSGIVAVFRGSPAGLVPGQLLDQFVEQIGTNEAGDQFGFSLAAADFNGDGSADLAISSLGEAPGNDPRSGFVFIFSGSRGGVLHPTQGLEEELRVPGTQQVLATNAQGDQFGFAMAAADFDGDRFIDLAVGSPNKAQAAGAVFVFRGSPTGLQPERSLTQASAGVGGPGQGDQFGFALAGGDLNGDGRAELAVGAPRKAVSGNSRDGAVFSITSTASGLRGGLRLNELGVQNTAAR